MTVYAIFFDMEIDTPTVYTLDEELVKELKERFDSADYVILKDITTSQWMSMLTGGKS